MVTHLSARLVWHDSGWNGKVCQNPGENSSCVMHDHVREEKDDQFEIENAGINFSDLDPTRLPPCSRDPGAFSPQGYTHLHGDPLDWRGHPPAPEEIPPYSFCTAPYEHLSDESTESGWVEGENEDVEVMDEFFESLTPKVSLVFFYSKDGHPLSEDHGRVIVGVGRIVEMGEQLYYPGTEDAVWSRRLTHNYEDEGVRIPYQEYLQEGQDVSELICEVPPQFNDRFSYVANHVSDDVAIGVLERILDSLRTVRNDGVIDGDWDEQIKWVESVLEEVWDNRGIYPGLESILDYLEADGTAYQRRVLNPMNKGDENPLEHIEGILENEECPKDPFDVRDFIYAQRKWKNLTDDERSILLTLTGFDLTESQVKRVINSIGYGETSIPISLDEFRENPYLLFEKDQAIGDDEPIAFETIDRGMQIDLSATDDPFPGFLLPVPSDDKTRTRAVLTAVLENVKNNGDTLLTLDEAVERAERFLPEERKCSPAVGRIKQDLDFYEETLVVSEDSGEMTIALPELHEMESEIAAAVSNQANKSLDDSPIDWRSIFDHILGPVEDSDLEPDTERVAREEKTEVLNKMYRSRFSVLTGAAGTGKTTVVSAFLRGLASEEGRTSKLLLAPTGKARVRLEETVADQLENGDEVEAKTIHQFLHRLGWLGEDFELKDEGDEGGAKTVIIDEASMIPTDLFATLLRATNFDLVKRLILVGDPNQLPPIGPGRPFFDIIQWLDEEHPERVGRLQQQVRYRVEEGSARRLADIYAGETPALNDEILSDIEAEKQTPDLRVHFWDNTDKLYDSLLECLSDILDEYEGNPIEAFDVSVGANGNIENVDDWQILSPTRIGSVGTQSINRQIQDRFRGHRIQDDHIFALGDEQVVPGDKVINKRNKRRYSPHAESKEYVANGEIGVVEETFKKYMHTTFPLKKHPISYNKNEVGLNAELGLAYGLTVHKAQGSDFDIVIMVLPQEAPTLSRELLYTGLTRYRDELILLIEQDSSELHELSKPENSDILRRNTALFEPSIRKDPDIPYPERLIHKTKDGTLVRSKSEVIIANILDELDLTYEYEEKLTPDPSAGHRWPDFTVYHEGETYYWEHLGMLHVLDYRKNWEKKREWYEENDLEDQLITSRDDRDGSIDSTEIKMIAQENILN